MDDVAAKRSDLANAHRLCARRLDLGATGPRLRQLSPENVVFAPAVDADHSKHVVVMGQERHVRRPDKVDDCQVVRLI